MATDNFDVWKKRWEALDLTIGDYIKELESGVEKNPCLSGLPTIVQCLQMFAKMQFGFFFKGFGGQLNYDIFDNRNFKLAPSREFPPQYVFKLTLDQVASDLEVFRRGMGQRISASGTDLENIFQKTDDLAREALAPVMGELLVDDPNQKPVVITYFEKSASVRVVPYARLVLIGVPITARTVAQDILAIAHEVGHYVYRQGRLFNDGFEDKGESIPRILSKRLLAKKSPKWVQEWKEEIFADVYSCLIAGPVIALASQDLALQTSVSSLGEPIGAFTEIRGNYVVNALKLDIYGEFTENDGEHPVPALRPYIYSKVLKAIEFEKASKLLNERWAEKLGERDSPDELFLDEYNSNPVKFNVARAIMESVVQEVLDLLPDPPQMPSWPQRWSGDLDDNAKVNDLDKLYLDFNVRLEAYQPDSSIASSERLPLEINLVPPATADQVWQGWVDREQFFPGFHPGKLPPSPIQIESGKPVRAQDMEHEPRYTWNHILHAAGWATKYGNHDGGGIIPIRFTNKEEGTDQLDQWESSLED